MDANQLLEQYRDAECFGDPKFHDLDHADCQRCPDCKRCSKQVATKENTMAKKKVAPTTKEAAAKETPTTETTTKTAAKAVKKTAKTVVKKTTTAAKRKTTKAASSADGDLSSFAQAIAALNAKLDMRTRKNTVYSFFHPDVRGLVLGIGGSTKTLRVCSKFLVDHDDSVLRRNAYPAVVLSAPTVENVVTVAKFALKEAGLK